MVSLKNDVLFLTYLISCEVTVPATVYILALYCNTRAFIQAPLSTAIFPQTFSFFTDYLVQWFRGLAIWWTSKGSLFKFKSVDCCKMHFSWIYFLFEFQSSIKSCEEKFTRKTLATLLYACNQRVRKMGEQNGKSFKSYSKTKKKRKDTNRLNFVTQFKIELLLMFTSQKNASNISIQEQE